MENENENAKVKKMPKGLIIGIVVAVVIIIIGVVLFILKPWSSGYVATVDNQQITTQEYMVFSKFNMSQFLTSISNGTTEDKYDWSTKINGETAKDQVKKSTLDNIQEIKIELAKAKEAGIKLDASDLKSIDDAINQRITESGTKDAAEQAIKTAYGVSLSEYKEVYKDLVLTQKYIKEERNKITVADDAVKKYFDNHKKEFDKATVTHLVISTVDSNGVAVSAGKKSEAKKKADDILVKIKAGGDIKALAKENSSSATTDNSQLTFMKGQLTSQYPVLAGLEDWSFGHAIGDVGIIDAAYGYDIVKLEKLAESTYDEVKEQIKASLITSDFSDQFTKKLEGWKKDKKFEIVKNDSVLAKVDLTIYRK